MERDNRYGAFLLLAIVFVGVFFVSHFVRYGVRGEADSMTVQIPPQPPLFQSGGGQIPLSPPFSKRGEQTLYSISPSIQSNNSVNPVSIKASRATVLQHKIDFPGFPIDINTADADELMKVPGIGPKTARNIIEKRVQIGGFSSINQLTEVKRIGRVRLDRIRRYIAIKAVKPVDG
ncbi:MAG: hypothetical protein A3J24_09445 [Deltaproteobacteria bacterium RIFCSPLOWO2_02_FULL_53_8]|nr:MAG: hypothetical protein A3J24_09445 [Deltaproteobacteria bacterium RIFCSPLOWO2_02_FULL_53_8]